MRTKNRSASLLGLCALCLFLISVTIAGAGNERSEGDVPVPAATGMLLHGEDQIDLEDAVAFRRAATDGQPEPKTTVYVVSSAVDRQQLDESLAEWGSWGPDPDLSYVHFELDKEGAVSEVLLHVDEGERYSQLRPSRWSVASEVEVSGERAAGHVFMENAAMSGFEKEYRFDVTFDVPVLSGPE